MLEAAVSPDRSKERSPERHDVLPRSFFYQGPILVKSVQLIDAECAYRHQRQLQSGCAEKVQFRVFQSTLSRVF